MGYGGKRDWKAADGRPELAVARGDRRGTRCAGKSFAGKNAGDPILAPHGRKPFWAESGTTDARGNVRVAKRAHGDGRVPQRNPPSGVVGERKPAAGVRANHAGSL